MFRSHGKIAYICEYSLHCSYKQMCLDGIHVKFNNIDFELEVLQMCVMYPIPVFFSYKSYIHTFEELLQSRSMPCSFHNLSKRRV